MEPQDLLGRFDGASQRILPSPSGVLDVVRDAKESRRLHVVVLEGFNRAPTEAYLLPILETAQAGRMGDEARMIPLAIPALLTDDDPYREMGRVAWPGNVLIACLPTDGNMTLPISRSLWRFLALLDADDRDRSSMPAVLQGVVPDCTEIAPTLWKDSMNRVQGSRRSDLDKLKALSRALSLSTRDSDDAVRLGEVLRLNGLPVADAMALAAGAILIPRSHAEIKTVDDAIRKAGVTVPGWQTILVEAQSLRS
jgi:hypothetical protein